MARKEGRRARTLSCGFSFKTPKEGGRRRAIHPKRKELKK